MLTAATTLLDSYCDVLSFHSRSSLYFIDGNILQLFNCYSACVSMDCVAMLNDEHFVSGSADGYVNHL